MNKVQIVTYKNFKLEFTPSVKKDNSTIYYMHIYYKGRRITPDRLGLFVKKGGMSNWMVINDPSAIAEMFELLEHLLVTVNHVWLVGKDVKVRSIASLQQHNPVKIWERSNNQ